MRILELRMADGRCVARNVRMACSFPTRLVGLIRHPRLMQEEGLLLVPGKSVHTIGMRCPIDIVFLSRQMRVLGLAENVVPWRFRVAPRGTNRVLELAAGRVAEVGLMTGMFLEVDSGGGNRTQPPGGGEGFAFAPCQRLPIQFSLRLPLERRCPSTCQSRCSTARTQSHLELTFPDPPADDSLAATRPIAGSSAPRSSADCHR